jgi:hypothetical protein
MPIAASSGKFHSFRARVFAISATTVIVLLVSGALLLLTDGLASQGKADNPTVLSKAFFILILFLFPLTSILCVVLAITAPLGAGLTWRRRVTLVMLGYANTILVYSAVYFCLAGIGDYNQAVNTNHFFKYYMAYPGTDWMNVSKEDLLKKVEDIRPFHGMKFPLYLAIHQGVSGKPGFNRTHFSGPEIVKLAQEPEELTPRKDLSSAFPLWIECFHFSVVTAATVGYGDITPAGLVAKIIADSQILASTAILVFGFGFVISGRPPRRE